MQRSRVALAGKNYDLSLQQKGEGMYEVTINGRTVEADVAVLPGGTLSLIVEGRQFEIDPRVTADGVEVERRGLRFGAEISDPRTAGLGGRKGGGAGAMMLKSPMPGKVVKVLVSVGQELPAGAGVMVVEAMKMQNELKTTAAVKVAEIFVKEGNSVEANGKLMRFEPLTTH